MQGRAMGETNQTNNSILSDADRVKMSDYYAECSNYSRNISNEYDGKLCEMLITAALAFLAIILTVFSMVAEKDSLSQVDKWLFILSVMSFVISVSIGIVHVIIAINFFSRISEIQGDVSNTLLRTGDIDVANITLDKLRQKKNQSAGKYSLWVQVLLFLLGVTLISIKICSSILL